MRAFIFISPFYTLDLHGIGDLGAEVVANGTEDPWCGLPWRERPALKISAKMAEASDPNDEPARRPSAEQTDES
ncbi:hypothetical protein [Mesorhizobium huakuii]|uniref:hypothetical protein n=1 Tax=Mesorhizobium huakuii TaxID=28104 RepID=UPI0024E04DD4|nr:hypothetical protein [Mesorhizobium huakuii]